MPIAHSIAVSPNGWTDAELGSIWLELVFEPQTKAKLTNDMEYRLLILDGHCSHCTLKFLALAEKYRIIVLCLPPHTTHALQPCDVGAFGPLSTNYKKEVSKRSKLNIAIKKDNILHVYGSARLLSFREATIKSAFRKTGIHPFNPAILPDNIFAPALTTSCHAAQPVPASSPAFINAIAIPYNEAASTQSAGPLLSIPMEIDAPEEPQFSLVLLDVPPKLPSGATRNKLLLQLEQLRSLLAQANAQIAADHAQKILMEQENGQLQAQLFLRSKEKDGNRALTSSARVLTHTDTQLLLQVYDYSERMKLVHEELTNVVAARTKRLEDAAKEKTQAQCQADAAAAKAQRETERETKRKQKAAAQLAEKERKARAREVERERKRAEKEAAKFQRGNRKTGPHRKSTANSLAFAAPSEKENTGTQAPNSPSYLTSLEALTPQEPAYMPSISRAEGPRTALQETQLSQNMGLYASSSREFTFQVNLCNSQPLETPRDRVGEGVRM